jgi:hypothetical protein
MAAIALCWIGYGGAGTLLQTAIVMVGVALAALSVAAGAHASTEAAAA